MSDDDEPKEYIFTLRDLEYYIGEILNKTDVATYDKLAIHPEWEKIKRGLAIHISYELIKEKELEEKKLTQEEQERQARRDNLWRKLELYSHPAQPRHGLKSVFLEVDFHTMNLQRKDEFYALIECLLDKQKLIIEEEE